MNIRSKVQSLVKKYNTRNPFDMIKGMNAIVVYYPLKDGIRGFYQYFKRNNIIYINEKLEKNVQSFVLAHEMGHMFLHRSANAIYMDTRTHFNTRKYEIQADKFAVELLIPDEIFMMNQYYTESQIARLTGYSEKLIKLRLQ